MNRLPVQGAARLCLLIRVKGKGQVYYLDLLHPHTDLGTPAFRLTKTNGENYDVIVTPAGATCECQDFVRCRDGKDQKGCKHIAGLRAVGLLR